jgi:hypothetical protein
MPSLPWTRVAELDPSEDYVVMATRFEVTSRIHMPAILLATQQLWSGFPATVGLVGYAVQARLTDGTLSTLSAWTDGYSLEAFVRGPDHTALVERTRRHLSGSSFAQWMLAAAELPPTWPAAHAALDAAPPRSR